jgi:hypothetical protein
MLIIRHDSPNETKKARLCILGRSLKWLEQFGGVLEIKTTMERAIISQSDEILFDPDKLAEDTDISNSWISDYNSQFTGIIEFKMENAIELRLRDKGTWKQVDANPPVEKVIYPIFSSSYGGDGITLPMILDARGLRILNNRE